MKKIVALILATSMTFSLAACSGTNNPGNDGNAPSADQSMTDIIFQSGAQGGNWAIVQPAMCTAIEDSMPGVTVTGITGTGAGNIRSMQAGECDIAMTHGYAYEDALKGVNDFEADGAIDNVSAIASLSVSYMYFVATASSGIQEIADIAASNLNCNTAGGGFEIATRRMLEAYGIRYEDIEASGHTLNYQGLSDVISLMQDGHVDVSLVSGMLDNPTTHQMESTFDIEILSFDGDGIKKFVNDYPAFTLDTMPAGIYKGQDEEKTVVAWNALMCCRKDMPEDVVYKITKALHENADSFAQVVPENAWVGTENCILGFDTATLHPGALRYYQEIGLL